MRRARQRPSANTASPLIQSWPATAAKHRHTTLDGEGSNSPFAIALLQPIATPGVEIDKLFRLVRDDVMEVTAGRQEPYTYGSLSGREEFFCVQR